MALDAALWRAAQRLAREVDELSFEAPVTHVYNPLRYAAPAYREYLRRYATSPKRIVYLGMNPGPWGMAQTGVPFGQVAAVRDWLGVSGKLGRPRVEHPRYQVSGFGCHRSEVSGARLWSTLAERYATPDDFFRDRFVANYCPLLFIAHDRNLVPEKLPPAERTPLLAACDRHLQAICRALEPEWVIGIGKFARERAEKALAGTDIAVLEILHPSPASPAANRGWAGQVDAQLARHGLTL
jgi:single-strand selective monofunctional uracil DNA glycosylase